MERPEITTDIKIAASLAQHIENPCSDSHGNNLRGFYIRIAERLIPTMTNPHAIEFLRIYINKYQKSA